MWNKLNAAWRTPAGKVVFAIALGVVLSDVTLRALEKKVSGNLAHVAEIPSLLDEAAALQRPTMLVMGNSLTNNGVAPELLRTVRNQGSVTKITPDGTNFWDWQCLIRHQVMPRTGLEVDTLVVGYAWHLLSDQTPADASRMGGLYCRTADVLTPRNIGLSSVGDTSEFLLARALRPYALRETLRNRGMSLLIPEYERFTQQANVNRAAASESSEPSSVKYTYERLAALAAELQDRGTRVVIVAMPVRSEYEVDPALQDLARENLIVLLDYRSTPGIDGSSFLDNMHLSESGQRVLTNRLAADLKTRLLASK